jgi:hypothetical protein
MEGKMAGGAPMGMRGFLSTLRVGSELLGNARMKKRCPECESTELMSTGRQHGLDALKHPMGWMFLFPAMPLLLLQAPVLMKCDDCGESFVQRSPWRWVYRALLALTLGFWAWVLVGVVRDAVE